MHLPPFPICILALASLPALAVAGPAVHGSGDPTPVADTLAAAGEMLVVDRGTGALTLEIPAAEELLFDVFVDLGIIGKTRVGSFELASGVEAFHPGLPASDASGGLTAMAASMPDTIAALGSAPSAGWIRGRARGNYLGFVLDHTIETRALPQEWPRLIYRDTAAGSSCRRREVRYGEKAGAVALWYRSDTHCKGCENREHFVEGTLFSSAGHCKRCKRPEHRVWNPPRTREIPTGTVDMLSAVYLCRSMVADGREEVTFPLLDKDRIWELGVKRGGRKRVTTRAGKFNCRAITLSPRPAAGEPQKAKAEFKGLFGIHGTLSIWVEERSGIPVRIEGTVPVGPFDLVVSLELRSRR